MPTRSAMVAEVVMATKTVMATSVVMVAKQVTNSMVVFLVVNLGILPGSVERVEEVDLTIPSSASYVENHTGQLIVPNSKPAKRKEINIQP